jgi:hypothetical protein
MVNVTVSIPDDVASRVAAAAADRGVTVEELASEALVRKALGAAVEAALLRAAARGEFRLEPPMPSDLERMAELVQTYADLPLGAVDAWIVATAERLGAATLATLNRRHFTVVRPAHVEAFTLLP